MFGAPLRQNVAPPVEEGDQALCGAVMSMTGRPMSDYCLAGGEDEASTVVTDHLVASFSAPGSRVHG